MKFGLIWVLGEFRIRNGIIECVFWDLNVIYIDKVVGFVNCNIIGNRDFDMFDDDW